MNFEVFSIPDHSAILWRFLQLTSYTQPVLIASLQQDRQNYHWRKQPKLQKIALEPARGSPVAERVAQFVLEVSKPQALPYHSPRLRAESQEHLFILIVIQSGIVWCNHASHAFVSEVSSLVCAWQPLLHVWLPHLSTGWVWEGTAFCAPFLTILALQHQVLMPAVVSLHPLVGSDFLLWKKRVSWRKKRMDTCLVSVLGCECPPACCQHLWVRFASLQPALLCYTEPLAPVVFSLPYPLCSLCSQLSFLFPCLSPFLFPLGLLFASPLQASCLPSKPALPTAGISRYAMLIHFVLALGALKPSDITGLHKLASTAAEESTWK